MGVEIQFPIIADLDTKVSGLFGKFSPLNLRPSSPAVHAS
jgi:hypothetical protein